MNEPTTTAVSPITPTHYITSFYDPALTMSIRKKECSTDKRWRFVDFSAGILFDIKPDNTVKMTEYQFKKCLEIIAVELREFLSAGFNPFTLGEHKLEVEPEQTERVKLDNVDELIPVFKTKIGGEEVNGVDAKELYRFLGVKTRFDTWIERRIKEYGFVINSDFCSFLGVRVDGRKPTEYRLTFDMAKELCMVENNAKGRQARRYFIACEKKLREMECTVTGQLFPVTANDLIRERDEAIKTKTEISDKKTATALGKVGNLTKKIKLLEMNIKDLERRLRSEEKDNAQTKAALESAKRLLDDLSPVFKK